MVTTDIASGLATLRLGCKGAYVAELKSRDSSGADAVVNRWSFEVIDRDTDISSYGPNNAGCQHNGAVIDGVEMDQAFTCNCSQTSHAGDNCEVPPASQSAATDDGVGEWTILISVIAAVLFVALLAVLAVIVVQARRANARHDFTDALISLHLDGGKVDSSGRRIPEEIPRARITAIKEVGQGEFAVEWKGMCRPKKTGHIEMQTPWHSRSSSPTLPPTSGMS